MEGKTTVAQAAKRLGVTTRTLYRWMADGKIKEAGRAGNTILLASEEVERLARERGNAPAPKTMDLAEAYVRLRDAGDDGGRESVMDDMAAAICATAADRGPLVSSWEAMCSMAATHPDGAGQWSAKAHTYGAWLGRSDDDTDKAIAHKAQAGSFTTAESAEAEAKAAPADPAYVIASASLKTR